LALKYGVHAKVIYRWEKEVVASIEAGFSGKLEVQKNGHATEVKGFHAKNGQLIVDQDFFVDASNRLRLGSDKKR
jgi:transposase